MSDVVKHLRQMSNWCHPNLLREAAEQIERLEAIVAKLPKTADGVPVYHTQRIWVRWHNRITQATVVEVRRDNVLCTMDSIGIRPRAFGLLICYSTRAAAEAAKEE